MPITFLDEEDNTGIDDTSLIPSIQPTKRKVTFLDEEPEEQVGTLQGIANSAQNAFDSSKQALLAVGGVDKDQAEQISKLEYAKQARKVSPDYAEYQKAEGWDAVGAFLKNPVEVTTNIIGEGLAGSLPALGAGVAAGAVGAAAGSVVPGLGTGIGYTAGQVAGTFGGSLSTEYGSKILEELQNSGMDITDPNSIQSYFSDEEKLAPIRNKALARGVPVAAFDAVSAGIGGKLGRVFGSEIIKEGEKVIGKQFATKTGEALTELGAQAILGGGGEAAGSIAAGDKVNLKDVFAEVVGEVGPGAAEVIQGRISDRANQRKLTEAKANQNILNLNDTLEQNNAPLTARATTQELAKQLSDDLNVDREKEAVELADLGGQTLKKINEVKAETQTATTKEEVAANLSEEDLNKREQDAKKLVQQYKDAYFESQDPNDRAKAVEFQGVLDAIQVEKRKRSYEKGRSDSTEPQGVTTPTAEEVVTPTAKTEVIPLRDTIIQSGIPEEAADIYIDNLKGEGLNEDQIREIADNNKSLREEAARKNEEESIAKRDLAQRARMGDKEARARLEGERGILATPTAKDIIAVPPVAEAATLPVEQAPLTQQAVAQSIEKSVAQPIEKQSYATQEIIQPEVVRQEPQDGTQVREKPQTIISDSLRDKEESIQKLIRDRDSSVGAAYPAVFNGVENLEIAQSVVSSLPVDVVNLFGGEKGAAQVLLNNPSMLKDSLFVFGDANIPRLSGDSYAVAVANLRAKLLSSLSAGGNKEFISALDTANRTLGEIGGLPSTGGRELSGKPLIPSSIIQTTPAAKFSSVSSIESNAEPAPAKSATLSDSVTIPFHSENITENKPESSVSYGLKNLPSQPTIGEISKTSPMIGEQPAQPPAPVTEQATPAEAPATGVAPIQRDSTILSQMTPDEAEKNTSVSRGRGGSRVAWIEKTKGKRVVGLSVNRPNVLQIIHKSEIYEAIGEKNPVSVISADKYKIKIPEGYVKQGDLYVYQPSSTLEPNGITKKSPIIKAEVPVLDPIGYGNALIDLFPNLKSAGVKAISMEESLERLEKQWEEKQKSGKATVLNQLVYLANKKNTENALAGDSVGGTWTRSDLTVAVSSKATPSAMAHEIGHAIMELEFSKADKKTKEAIAAEYGEWFKSKYGKDGVPSFADQRRIWEWMEESDWLDPKAPVPEEMRSPKWEAYRSSFREWFADEVAKWATIKEKPKSLIGKFFTDISKKLEQLWNAVSENFSPNETLATWLDSITDVSPSKISETITEPATQAGPQVGQRVRSGSTPQPFVITEVTPQTARDVELGEQYYKIKNERTGEVSVVESVDITPVKTTRSSKKLKSVYPSRGGVEVGDMNVSQRMEGVLAKITPKTPEEETAFQKALSNKMMARNPELAIAAVRLKNGEITAGEYADLIDIIDPFTIKGSESIPTKSKIDQYIDEGKKNKVNAPIENGKEVEFRIDIPTYNRSTAAGDTVYAVTAHEPVPETSKRVGIPISYVGVAKVINPKMMTRSISGKGEAIDIATGSGKFPLATVKGNYEAITELPADINDPNAWTEVSYNPIRSSYFVDVRSKNAVVGGEEAIMVGSRVFVKNPQMQARPTGVVGGNGVTDIRYARARDKAKYRQKYKSIAIQAKVQNYIKIAQDEMQEAIDNKDIELAENIQKNINTAFQYNINESELYTQEDLVKGVANFFNGSIPDNVIFVEDIGFNGYALYNTETGQIEINRAYFKEGKKIDSIIAHELGHYAFGDPVFRQAILDLWNGLTPQAREAISRFVEKNYSDFDPDSRTEEKIIYGWEQIIEANPEVKSSWDKFVQFINYYLNKYIFRGQYVPKNSTKVALDVLNSIRQEFINGKSIIREDGSRFTFAARATEDRSQVHGQKQAGRILNSFIGGNKIVQDIVRQNYFDSTQFNKENTQKAYDLLQSLIDFTDGNNNDFAIKLNEDIQSKLKDYDVDPDIKQVIGVQILRNELQMYSNKLTIAGDSFFEKIYKLNANDIPLGIKDVTSSNIARALAAIAKINNPMIGAIQAQGKGEIVQLASTTFGTKEPSTEQINVIEEALKESGKAETIDNADILDSVVSAESKTGVNIRKDIDAAIAKTSNPKKNITNVAYKAKNSLFGKSKKVKQVTTVNENIQNIINGNLANYRDTLVQDSANGLQSTFWKTLSDKENKPGPLGELDQAQNNELANIVKNALVKAGLKGTPPNTKMTDIEKVASILNEQKLSIDKQVQADKIISEDIQSRRESELANTEDETEIDSINDKYDAIQAAWDDAMQRQTDMPVSDVMLKRLLNSEMKELNTSASDIAKLSDDGINQKSESIVDSLIKKIYGVSKESLTGIEIDEDYNNLRSYLNDTLNNLVQIQKTKIEAAKALAEARRQQGVNPNIAAEQIIEKMGITQSGVSPVSRKTENNVRSIVQQDLRQRPDMGRKEAWKSMLTAKLINAGVTEDKAVELTDLVWKQHEINNMNREIKLIESAAENGSLGVIIEMIKNTPLQQQSTPEWRKEVIRQYLMSSGLSEKQAESAARLYDNIIAEKIAEAKQKAFEQSISKTSPWRDHMSRNGQLAKDALKKVLNAVRTSALDPTQNTESIIAKQNGWTGFSEADFRRIAEIDEILNNPETDKLKKSELMKELNEIISKTKLPVTVKQALAAYYTGQALMGVPTVTVNIFSPLGFSLRNLFTDIARFGLTDPTRIPLAFDTFLDSMRSWYNQTKYAFKNEVYPNDVIEYLNGNNVLKELYNKGKKEWKNGDRASGMRDMLVGMTQITGRVLSALDQGAISALENQAVSRYAMEAMSLSNIPRSKRNAVASQILQAKRNTYASLIASGMEKERAGVLADMEMKNEIKNQLSSLNIESEKVNDVINSAINDALLSVGRNRTISMDGLSSEQKRLSDSGMASYLPIKFLEQMASSAAQQGPAMQIFSKMLYGFALVPARTFHNAAWYSPYGFLRIFRDKYQKSKGMESSYALSLGNELQYRQRLTESIAGSIAMLSLAALAASSADDDDDRKFKIVVTGNGPDAAADKQYYDSWIKKWKPNSIHIVMGDTVIPINIGRGGEAVFFPIMLAGALDDWNIRNKMNKAKKKPADLNQATVMLGSAFLALAQRGPYAAFGKSLFNANRTGQLPEELAAQAGYLGKTFVPILGTSLARNISDLINDPIDKSSMSGAMYSNIPIVGPMIGTKALNAFGQPIRADDWGDRLFKLGVPMVFSFPKNTPENALNELVLSKGDGPTIPTRRTAESRLERPMTNEEFYAYVKAYGDSVSKSMFRHRNSLERMDSSRYQSELEDYSKAANERATRTVKRMSMQ